MKLSKRLQDYMKYRGFKLKPRSKPIDIPYHHFIESGKIDFYGARLLQVLEKKAWVADQEIKDQGYQSSGWGGGGSGLSQEERKDLNKMFQFKYMGYAEYEWGVLAKSYHYLTSHFDELIFSEVTLFGQTFYTMCLKYHEKFISKTIEGVIANNQFPIRISKQDINLDKVIQDNNKNFVGAWNLDSHYLFFTNKARFLKFKKHLKEKHQTQVQDVA